ncbi:MAG: DNA polymerase III subunit delta [Actinomycetota bacterium]|nr:DNA polymerase III subunit delta [Actinomycetota bacterium]
MPAFKPAYLIHGDDHGRIAERRARLRELAERDSGVHGIELFEGERATPAEVAAALDAMTLAIGRRFIIVDGAERFKDREMDALEAALAHADADTTVAFFAREEGRLKAPPRLHAAVKRAGGDISAEQSVKPWELPRWAIGQARALGLELTPEAARTLVGHVGDRQQRLLRELEKLALQLPPRSILDAETIVELTAASAERQAWALADALLGGDVAAAIGALLALRAQGERAAGLVYWMSARLRQAHQIAHALESGQSQAQVRAGLRMPPSAADRLIASARQMGSARLERAICLVADLELASRGAGASADDTALLRTVLAVTAA